MAMPSIRAALLCVALAIAVVPLYVRLRDRELFRPSTDPVAAGDANQAETRNYTSSPGFRPSHDAAFPNHANPTPIIRGSTEHNVITPDPKKLSPPNKNDALNLKA